MIKNKLRLLNEEINVEDDKIYPTHDADINFIEFLRNATIFGLDDEGNEIPGYIFADEITEMFGIGAEETIEFAREQGYIIYIAKVLGEELPADMYVICAEGCDTQLIKNDFKEIHEVEIELELAEDEEDTLKEDTKTQESGIRQDDISNFKYYIKANSDNISFLFNQDLSEKELIEAIGWLVTNIKEIEMTIPEELKDAFESEFKEYDTKHVTYKKFYKDEKSSDNKYYVPSFFNTSSTKIKFKSNYKVIKSVKGLATRIRNYSSTKESVINSYSFAKYLIKEYGFKIGPNDSKALSSSIQSELPEDLKIHFISGLYSINIEKQQRDLKKIYDEEHIDYSNDVDEWLKKNVTNINFQVASHLEGYFLSLVGEGVKYTSIDTSMRNENGQLKKWGISGTVTLSTLKGMPESLRAFVKGDDKTIHSKNLALILIRDFGNTFYKNNKGRKSEKIDETLIEADILKDRAKKHKKTDVKGSRGWFVNKDAGDVEHNIAVFNRIAGGSTTTADGGIGTVGVAESVVDSMIESLPTYLYHATFKPRLSSIKKYGLGGRLPRMRSYDYEGTSYQNKKQGVFLATSYHVAYSYAEIAFEDVDDGPEWIDDLDHNIIVYAIAVENLNKDLIEEDINVIDGYATVFYDGVIPFKHLIKVEDDIEESLAIMKESVKTLDEMLPHEDETKVDFVDRFMSEMADEYENPKQRYAVALQYWEKKDE